MKRLGIILILLFICAEWGQAQVVLGRKVFSNGGTSVTVGGFNYNYTIGEAIVGTKNGSIPQYTLGFQQPIPISILPVSLLDFEAKQVDHDAILSWTTVWEVNSDRFEIERSFDRADFTFVGSLPAKGESMEPVEYQAIDPGIVFFEENIIYYRLKQIDINGAFTYSDIKELHILKPDQNFLYYPNPAHSQVTLQFNQSDDPIMEISLWNPLGQRVWGRFRISPFE